MTKEWVIIFIAQICFILAGYYFIDWLNTPDPITGDTTDISCFLWTVLVIVLTRNIKIDLKK